LHGLVDRGFDVTMFHTGRHELTETPDVEHVHGDPFDEASIETSLEGRSFDVTVATYGRVRLIARSLAGRTTQFISVGGTPVYRGFVTPGALVPRGLPIGFDEDFDRVPAEGIPGETYGSAAIRRTEDAVFALGDSGAFGASVFRYPSIYGPRNPHHWEWCAVKRVLDGRDAIMLPDGGLPVHSRLSAWNAAHSMLLAIDRPDEAAGQAFNCADDDQFSLRQWFEMAAGHAGGSLDVVSVPGDIPSPAWATMVFHYSGSPHVIVDTTRIRTVLGYTDAKPAREGLAETVAWIIAHESEAAGWSVLDPFDYESEDRFLEAWRTGIGSLGEVTERWKDLSMPLPQTVKGKGS
jgi:nucleoside-diphosphate-sugar epimerase